MNENKAKNDNVGNEDNWSELRQIGDIFISCGWENNQAILILENKGQNEEDIEIRYQESLHPTTKPLKFFEQLPPGKPQTVQLPTRFEHWEELRFVGIMKNPSRSVPITDLIAALKELRDEIKNQGNSEPLRCGSESLSPKLKPSNEYRKPPRLPSFQVTKVQHSDRLAAPKKTSVEVKRKNQANEQLPSDPEQQKNLTSNYEKRPGRLEHEIQNQQENTIHKLQNEVNQLEQTGVERQKEIDSFREQIAELSQENSELKRQLDTQTIATSRNPEQVFREAAHHVLQTSFVQHEKTVGETLQDPIQICDEIEAGINRFEEQFDGEITYTLSVVKEHLTKVKGLIQFELSELSPSESQPERLAKLVLTDKPPGDVQFPYLGELGKAYWDDLKAFAMKLPQVILETQTLLHRIVIQLLDGFSPYRAKTAKEIQMSRCFYEDYLPNILQMMSLELVPTKIGYTEVDSRIHDIQGSQRGAYQRGVVADIIQHGVRRISDKQIIRKPVVIRGEPE